MGTHRPTPGPRVGAKLGTALAATAAIVAVPMTGELPVASAHVPDGPTTTTQPAQAPAPAAEVTPAPAPAERATGDVYTVRQGDNLGKIGASLGVPWRDIATVNGISAPWTIYVGQDLHVPSGRVTPAASPAAPVEAPASVAGGTAAAAKAVQVAVAQVGDAYVWAAAGPSAFDCSGLVQYAYAAAGIKLPHSSGTQASMGRAVSRADLQPGDLVAYYSPVSHIGIYIGNGKVVQAANEKLGVTIQDINWGGTPTALRRIA